MVEIKVCRHTGKELSIKVNDSPQDQSPILLAEIVASWAIKTGQLKKLSGN